MLGFHLFLHFLCAMSWKAMIDCAPNGSLWHGNCFVWCLHSDPAGRHFVEDILAEVERLYWSRGFPAIERVPIALRLTGAVHCQKTHFGRKEWQGPWQNRPTSHITYCLPMFCISIMFWMLLLVSIIWLCLLVVICNFMYIKKKKTMKKRWTTSVHLV